MSIKIKIVSEPAMVPYKDFTYETYNDGIIIIDDSALIIPKGYRTDLASIPRAFWSIYPPQKAKFVMPSILHDYLYSTHYRDSRKLADDIFYESLVLYGVSKSTSFIFWSTVRLFGERHYKR